MPVPGCVLLGLSRMKRILAVDLENRWVRVEPGVINLEISKRLFRDGYYYAPDPSSQQVCTIGGNVAENSGGAHCLKYGFTTNHVLGATIVLGDGEVVTIGGPVLDPPGYDLRGALVGSEGTLGVITEVVLRILRKPEATRTLFATFPSTDGAGDAVSLIVAAGIVPAAIEMMDRLAITAIKAATGVDWPDVGAALLIDVDGPLAEVEHTAAVATRLCRQASALEIRLPRDAGERDAMWVGSVQATSCRTGSFPDRSSPRCCAKSRRSASAAACGSRMSSTPATAICTRWYSTTRPLRGRRSERRRAPARSCACV
jgi:glycolate oxidase